MEIGAQTDPQFRKHGGPEQTFGHRGDTQGARGTGTVKGPGNRPFRKNHRCAVGVGDGDTVETSVAAQNAPFSIDGLAIALLADPVVVSDAAVIIQVGQGLLDPGFRQRDRGIPGQRPHGRIILVGDQHQVAGDSHANYKGS